MRSAALVEVTNERMTAPVAWAMSRQPVEGSSRVGFLVEVPAHGRADRVEDHESGARFLDRGPDEFKVSGKVRSHLQGVCIHRGLDTELEHEFEVGVCCLEAGTDDGLPPVLTRPDQYWRGGVEVVAVQGAACDLARDMEGVGGLTLTPSACEDREGCSRNAVLSRTSAEPPSGSSGRASRKRATSLGHTVSSNAASMASPMPAVNNGFGVGNAMPYRRSASALARMSSG